MTPVDKKDDLTVRATCLNCMDGRVQLPVLNWIQEKYNIDFVDVITEAGMDGVIASQENIDEIIRSIKISVNINKSIRIFLVGHHDCRGNSVDEGAHHEHIIKAVARLKVHWPEFEIVGLWVNSHWQVEVCCK
ncbi:MAG: hypothetical protein PHY73_01660 [Candidatus Omnitrophica bacterium]|nr:hypothetical protein [Candidatus Omnitrophota bacterium]